jgi:putative ABC transport system permease protein
MSLRVSWLDVSLGIRMMIKHPALTLVGGLGIAVGIAVSVGFFSVTRSMIYPELPLEDGDRIVALENRDVTIDNEERRSLHDFVLWRDELQSIDDLTAFQTVERNLITGDGAPELVHVARMSAAGFRIARVPPLLGRHLLPDDEQADAPHVLVIGYPVWENRFANDPDVIGRTVRLGGVPHTIVGVMPEGFAFPESHRYWTALRADPSAHERRAGPPIFIAGRLAQGATIESAQAELSAIGQRTAAAHPDTHEFLRPMVMPYTHSLTDVQGISLWMVVQMNMVMTLLLIVIALNVAVLVYARTAARHSEIAVRHALGASRGRVVAQLFVESLVLSLVAAAAGVALAQVGVDLGHRIMAMEQMDTPFWLDTSLRPATILLAIVLAVVTAVLTGVLPALQATGRRLQLDMRELGSARMRLGRTWSALIVVQVAIAVAALPAAVNMGWTEIRAAATRLTYPAHEFVRASVVPEVPEDGADDDGDAGAERLGGRLTELMQRLDAEPTVAGVAYIANLPGREGMIQVEGLPLPTEQSSGHQVNALGVHPDFTRVIGARILSGRALRPADMGAESSTVVVTEAFVRRVLGDGEALGRRIRHVSEEERAGQDVSAPVRWYEIVGVMQDLNTNPAAPELVRPAVYYAVGPDQARRAVLTVRFRGSTPAEVGRTMREVAAEVDPALRIGTVRSMADGDQQRQLAARLVGLAVGLILLSVMLLSAAGIYAMMSFAVTQRRREIGIRSALGAQPRQLLKSVFARAATQIGAGVVVGVGAAAAIERVTGGGLVSGRGAVLLPGIAVIMTIVGLLAALGPARRGLGIQPTEALKGDG